MPLETLGNYKTPLGKESISEYGDISDPKQKKYIEEYAPIKNIDLNKPYPNIFIYTNYYDTLVPYKEPLNYYNAIKKAKIFKETHDINIYIDNNFGHVQGSSLDSKCKSYAILMDQLLKYI